MKTNLGLRGVTLAALAISAAFAAADTVQVNVNGNPVQFPEAQPQTVGGRVLVPLRGVFEQMGAEVHWNEASQSVTANGNGRHIRLRIGSMDASVNDRVVSMDVAPQLIDGSTMVPLRFLGEALGAHVDWRPEDNLVAISTRNRDGAAQRFGNPDRQTPPPVINTPPPVVVTPPERTVIIDRPAPPKIEYRNAPDRPWVITRDTVIPLRLDQQITSNGNRAGDRFTASIRGDAGRYLDFPDGTIIEGVVRSATPAGGSHAGTLDVRFTHIRFPDGNRYPIGGIVTKLDNKEIVRTGNGRFVAKGGADDTVARDAEIGAGAGLVLGSIHGRAVGGAAIGGALGALVGALDHNLARNVILDQGTRLGLILNRDLEIDRKDIR